MNKIFIFLTAIFIITCTSNPIFDDKINNKEKLSVEGQVFLNGDGDNSGVYVWFDGLNYSVYTDSTGFYKFELPPANLQPGGGISGIFKIYYYVNNYKIDSASTLIINGEFQYGNGNIEPDGTIRPKVLKKLLEIETILIPDRISNISKDTLDIRINLNPLVDTLIVFSLQRASGQTSCIFIIQKDDPPEKSILLQGAGTYLTSQTLTVTTEWRILYVFPVGFFSLGEYDFIPYIIIEQEGVPKGLLDSIDPNLQNFSYEYLKTPTKQSFGKLVVYSNSPA